MTLWETSWKLIGKERKTSYLKSNKQTLILNAEITSGLAPAYFCGIITVFLLLVVLGFFPLKDPCKIQDERDLGREI